MGKIDPQQERERLSTRYAAMSDLELLKVGRNPAALTDWAFEALREEVAKRGVAWEGSGLPLPSQMGRSETRVDSPLPSSTGRADANDAPGNIPVVIRQYRDMPAALTDRMILETAGIDCYLYDENMVRLDWLYSNLLGGLKLVVRQGDAEDAEKALSGATNEKFEVDGVGEYEQERCPDCGSMDVSYNELKKRIAGAGLLLFQIPIAMHQAGWNCHNCGHIWNPAEAAKPGKEGN
jgi:DNA-directed RNA polymerase subunit M/transcription elongation factor TFIIS